MRRPDDSRTYDCQSFRLIEAYCSLSIQGTNSTVEELYQSSIRNLGLGGICRRQTLNDISDPRQREPRWNWEEEILLASTFGEHIQER